MYNTPVSASLRPVEDDENALRSLWYRVRNSYPGTRGTLREAGTGTPASHAPSPFPLSALAVVSVMDTTQLGELAPVRFSATATSDWKCGCPATMSEPRASNTRLSGAKGVGTRARSESAWVCGSRA